MLLSAIFAAALVGAPPTPDPATEFKFKDGDRIVWLGNTLVVLLFLVSWLLRGDSLAAPGAVAIVLALAGGGLSLVTGWLGGELVNRLGVGVDDGAHLDAPSSLSGKPASGMPDRTKRSPSSRR